MQERKSSAPRFPDAQYVGDHLVIDKTEWAPGAHPEPHMRHEEQTMYPESYFRCVLCGAEWLRKRDIPEGCDAERDVPTRGDAGGG